MKVFTAAAVSIALLIPLAGVAQAKTMHRHHHGMMTKKRPMMQGQGMMMRGGNKNGGSTPNKYTNMGH